MRMLCALFPLRCTKSKGTLLDVASNKRIIIAQYILLLAGETVSTLAISNYFIPISALLFGIGIIILYPVLMEFRNFLQHRLELLLNELLANPKLVSVLISKARKIALLENLKTRRFSGNTVFTIILIGIVIGVIYAGVIPRCIGHNNICESITCTLHGPEHIVGKKYPIPLCFSIEMLWGISILMYTYIYMYAISAIPYIISLLSILNNIKNQDIYDTRLGQLLKTVQAKPLDTGSYDLKPLLEFHNRVSEICRPTVKLVIALMVVALLAIIWYKKVKGYGTLVIALAIVIVSIAILIYAIYVTSSLLISVRDKTKKAVKMAYVVAAREAYRENLDDIPKPILRMIDTLNDSIEMLKTIPLSVHDIFQLVGVAATLIALIIEVLK